MFIDQFTPEQIELIKKELQVKQKSQKQAVLQLDEELRKMFPIDYHNATEEEQQLWHNRQRFDKLLYEMIDLTLQNNLSYERTFRGMKLVRGSSIDPELKNEYIEMANELMTVINKHKK